MDADSLAFARGENKTVAFAPASAIPAMKSFSNRASPAEEI
jgi:hypothetical protein